MNGCLPMQALAFLAVFVYAAHATQAIAFEWKPGLKFCVQRQNNASQTFIQPTEQRLLLKRGKYI